MSATRWIWIVSAAGCQAPDPLDVAWNAVFEVRSYAVGEGCEVPEVGASEPPERFVAIGVGRIDDIELASAYWCRSESACDGGPFSNAVLEVATPTELAGTFAENAYDARRICKAWWVGIDAEQTVDGELTLISQSLSTENVSTATSAECDDFLARLVRQTCDETVRIEALRVP